MSGLLPPMENPTRTRLSRLWVALMCFPRRRGTKGGFTRIIFLLINMRSVTLIADLFHRMLLTTNHKAGTPPTSRPVSPRADPLPAFPTPAGLRLPFPSGLPRSAPQLLPPPAPLSSRLPLFPRPPKRTRRGTRSPRATHSRTGIPGNPPSSCWAASSTPTA